MRATQTKLPSHHSDMHLTAGVLPLFALKTYHLKSSDVHNNIETLYHHNTAKLTILLHPCCPKSNFTLLSWKIILLNLFPPTLTEAERTEEPVFLRGHHPLLILLTESGFSFSCRCFGRLNFTHTWSLQLFAVTHSVPVQRWGCLSQFRFWIVLMNKGPKP